MKVKLSVLAGVLAVTIGLAALAATLAPSATAAPPSAGLSSTITPGQSQGVLDGVFQITSVTNENGQLVGHGTYTGLVNGVQQTVPDAWAVIDPPNTCTILDLTLGPLHLDLLGLNVDLYGKTKSDPVEVTITAVPGEGLLGDVLCSLAGHGNITSLAGLQGLLKSVGVTVADSDLQNLLNSLGINLVSGLTNLDLQRILQGLQPPPSG